MAKVAIFTGPQRRWVQFDEDTEVLVEYLDRPAAIALNNEVDKVVARTGQDRQKVWGQMLGAAVVHGWRNKFDHQGTGVVMPDGTPLLFTDDNRDLMMSACREFSLFVNESAIDAKIFLELQEKAKARVEQKNG